jgi:hypothetical protein
LQDPLEVAHGAAEEAVQNSRREGRAEACEQALMAGVASRTGKIARIDQGDVRLHHANGDNRVTVWLTAADNE